MPGFTIHIAIAKLYISKHKLEIKDEKEFIKGSIAPDLNEEMSEITKEKSKTHYGKWGTYETITHLNEFLNDEKIDMNKDYWKGYYLHLLADDYFYNRDKYFKKEYDEVKKNNDKLSYDFDCINKDLIYKYEIEVLENIKKYMNIYDGEPKYLKLEKIFKFIEDISNINIQDEIQKMNYKDSH